MTQSKRKTQGISFADESVLEAAKKRTNELGIRSLSDYINQLIRRDVGMPTYLAWHIGNIQKSVSTTPELANLIERIGHEAAYDVAYQALTNQKGRDLSDAEKELLQRRINIHMDSIQLQQDIEEWVQKNDILSPSPKISPDEKKRLQMSKDQLGTSSKSGS